MVSVSRNKIGFGGLMLGAAMFPLLAVAADVAPTAPAALTYEAPVTTAVPMTYEALAKAYVQHNKDSIAADKEMTTAYANRFLCDEYLRERNNEFNLPKILTHAEDIVKGMKAQKAPYWLRISTNFATYDSAKHQFSFPAIDNQHNIFNITDPKTFTANGYAAASPCVPSAKGWPKRFNVVIEDYDLIDSIPMSEDQAKSLLAVRTNRPAAEQRKVGLNVSLVLKDWQAPDDKGISTVTADIVAANIDDGTEPTPTGPTAQTLYTYDAAYIAAHKPQVEKRLADEHEANTKGPQLFAPDALQRWLDVFTKNGSKALPDGTQLRQLALPTNFAVSAPTDTPGIFVSTFDRNITVSQPMPGGDTMRIRFMNKEDFQDLVPLPLSDYKQLSQAGGTRASIIITPMGGEAFPPYLYMHADKLVFELAGPEKTKIEILAKTPATPYVRLPPVKPEEEKSPSQ